MSEAFKERGILQWTLLLLSHSLLGGNLFLPFCVIVISDTSYTMSVKLGDVLSPDTNLYVQLFGEKGETSKIMLRPIGSSLNKFEKGRTYKFTVETVNIGKVSLVVFRVSVCHTAGQVISQSVGQ